MFFSRYSIYAKVLQVVNLQQKVLIRWIMNCRCRVEAPPVTPAGQTGKVGGKYFMPALIHLYLNISKGD